MPAAANVGAPETMDSPPTTEGVKWTFFSEPPGLLVRLPGTGDGGFEPGFREGECDLFGVVFPLPGFDVRVWGTSGS